MRTIESNAKFVITLWVFAGLAVAAGWAQIFPGVIATPAIDNESIALVIAFAILAIGVAPLAAAGIFDFSVAGVFLFAHFIAVAGLEKYDWYILLAIAAATALAAAALNGLLNSALRLPPAIATLITGIIAAICGVLPVRREAAIAAMTNYYYAEYFLPLCAAIAALFVICIHFFMTRATTGLRLRAIGDNAEKAGMIGINRPTRLLLAYLFGSGAAVIAAIISAGAARNGIEEIFNATHEVVGETELLAFLTPDAHVIAAGLLVATLLAAPLWCATAAGRRGHINVIAILLAAFAIAVFISTIKPLLFVSYFIGALLLFAGLGGREKRLRVKKNHP